MSKSQIVLDLGFWICFGFCSIWIWDLIILLPFDFVAADKLVTFLGIYMRLKMFKTPSL